jgi:hypothetical protein
MIYRNYPTLAELAQGDKSLEKMAEDVLKNHLDQGELGGVKLQELFTFECPELTKGS